MATRVGINGFGRIGRLVFRTIRERHAGELQVVAINDLVDTATNAHLLKYDSNYGAFKGQVAAADGGLLVDGELIKVFAERDPAAIPWGEANVDIVIESTGFFTHYEDAQKHVQAGAKRVIISAPAKGDEAIGATVLMGLNEDRLAGHAGTSKASCTTNASSPVIAILDEAGADHWAHGPPEKVSAEEARQFEGNP